MYFKNIIKKISFLKTESRPVLIPVKETKTLRNIQIIGKGRKCCVNSGKNSLKSIRVPEGGMG